MFGAVKPGFRNFLATLNLYEYRRRTLNREEKLRHRAVSLRQHGFLVLYRATSVLHALHAQGRSRLNRHGCAHSSRKRMKHGKKRKKSRFLDFEKKT